MRISSVQALDGVSGVDHFSQVRRVIEELRQTTPVMLPGSNQNGMAFASLLLELQESELRGFDGRNRIDRTHIGAERLSAPEGNEPMLFLSESTRRALHVFR